MMDAVMRTILEYVTKELVDNPALCSITVSEHEGVPKYEILVSQADRGKVIGRQGNTIKALRTVMAILSPDGVAPLVEIAGE
jgi:predicted RNA-binding protein YlqC (UPF0109 family)